MSERMDDRVPRRAGRMGAWRLVEIVHATMNFRAGMFGAGAILPEYGPADAAPAVSDPEELPASNIGEREQQQAIQRERARRFVRVRR